MYAQGKFPSASDIIVIGSHPGLLQRYFVFPDQSQQVVAEQIHPVYTPLLHDGGKLVQVSAGYHRTYARCIDQDLAREHPAFLVERWDQDLADYARQAGCENLPALFALVYIKKS